MQLPRTKQGETKNHIDEERFESLYRAHYDAVLGYVLRRARAEIADDVVAETFTVAWRRRAVAPDDPLPWLLGIARRVLANEQRGARRRDAFLLRRAPDLVGPATTELTIGRAAKDILQALQRLRPRDRELLLLVAWEGLAPTQAARVLGESPLTCRVRLHRARRRLASVLMELGQLDGDEQDSSAAHPQLTPRQEHG
jgi:RNA polymerase sigma-70 factor, ECF subfamily